MKDATVKRASLACSRELKGLERRMANKNDDEMKIYDYREDIENKGEKAETFAENNVKDTGKSERCSKQRTLKKVDQRMISRI